MTLIPISDDLARLIDGASSPVILVSPQGKRLGEMVPEHSEPLPPDATEAEVIADIKRRIARHDGKFRLASDVLKELRERFPE